MDERNSSEDIVTGTSLRFQLVGEIQQVGGESFGSIFLLFSNESSQEPHSY